MPDSLDYKVLQSLLSHPEAWSDEDLEKARSMRVEQRRAVEAAHPKDVRNRRSLTRRR